MERNAGVVRRAADGRWRPASVVVAIRTRTKCGERIIRQTALGSVTVWRTAQQIDTTVFVSHITHSTHCTNSELVVSPRLTALSIFIQQCLTWKCRKIAPPVWTQRRSRDLSSPASKQNKWKSMATGLCKHSCSVQPMRTQVQSVTGMKRYAYICKYAKQWHNWTWQ